jgi:hypothetical protein
VQIVQFLVHKDPLDRKGHRVWAHRDHRVLQVPLGHKVLKDHKDHKVLKDHKDHKDHKAHKE